MASTPTWIRLGTASPGTRPTTRETLAQLDDIAQRAAARGVDVLLLPEAYIGGYPRGASFGSVVGARSPAGRDAYLRYFRAAVDLGDTVGDAGGGGGDAWVHRTLPGPADAGDGTREELERIARASGVFLVVGCIERAGGSLYCAAVYVCPKLGAIGKRRKVMPVRFSPQARQGGLPRLLRKESADRHRTPRVGAGLAGDAAGRQHHRPRGAHQPRRRHLLGELHAARAAGAVRAECQLVSGADGRRPRHVAAAAAHRRR